MPNNDDTEVNVGERRQLTLREFSTLVLLLLNFGGIVWGAATMSNSILQLRTSVAELRAVSQSLVSDLVAIKVDYNARIRVLEDRMPK